MLDQKMRAAILVLHGKGRSNRSIAKALKISRGVVKDVIASGSDQVPLIVRAQLADPWREEILAQHASCGGNLVRVREELAKKGAQISYPALTSFCRRHGIGYEPPKPSGRYDFTPGEEMQHDTSPHWPKIDGVQRSAQTASLVLCFSRMFFFQLYPRFTRFECKVFLTDAFDYFEGLAGRCMIDNTHVIVLKGSGSRMVPVPEMAAFAERYGFEFRAHEIGDANRSARVEGPFNYIENNFLAGREFRDWRHLNQEARIWCDQKNAAFSRSLHASRRELFAAEKPHLKPLPIYVPEVYVLHHRIVDAEGYVNVRSHRYSVPYALIGRQLEVRETKERIEVFDGPRVVATHERVLDGCDMRVTNPAHRPPRGQGRPKEAPPPEEESLLKAEPSLAAYVAALKKRASGRGTLALRRLLKLLREYPRTSVRAAVRQAEQYGLYDLDRLERMVLKEIAHEYFVLPADHDDEEGGGNDE
jgi:transposase